MCFFRHIYYFKTHVTIVAMEAILPTTNSTSVTLFAMKRLINFFIIVKNITSLTKIRSKDNITIFTLLLWSLNMITLSTLHFFNFLSIHFMYFIQIRFSLVLHLIMANFTVEEFFTFCTF